VAHQSQIIAETSSLPNIFLPPVFHHFLGDIPLYSSNEFLGENLAMEFASRAWDVELDSGKPKPASRVNKFGWQFHLQGTDQVPDSTP
jgi:hypothetical protein